MRHKHEPVSGPHDLEPHMLNAANGGEVHEPCDAPGIGALPADTSNSGQFSHDILGDIAADSGGEGQSGADAPDERALAADLFQYIRKAHRTRQFAMEARKRSDLALGAFLREQLGWTRDKPQTERTAIAERAAELVSICERAMKWEDRIARKPDTKLRRPNGYDAADFLEWRSLIESSLRGRESMAQQEDIAKARMVEIAAELPVTTWWREHVFSELTSLAVLVAEIGDLSQYATVSKVWKRMGVAVMDGVRQGGLAKTASKDAWIAHGYVRRRRSYLFVIGDTLIKQNEHYRAIYLAEKERQRAKAAANGITVVPAAKIPAKRASEFMSDGHVHNRARRYMEKTLLRDLWVAWRARAPLKPIVHVLAEHSSDQTLPESPAEHVADGGGQLTREIQSVTATPDLSSDHTIDETHGVFVADGNDHSGNATPPTLAVPIFSSADEADARGHSVTDTQVTRVSRKHSAAAGNGTMLGMQPVQKIVPFQSNAEQSAEPLARVSPLPSAGTPEAHS